MSEMLNDTLSVPRGPVKHSSFTGPYWEGTRQKKLVIQYCPCTKRYQFFPRAISVYSGHRDLEWREVSGKGELYSYTITRRARGPFQEAAPFAIAAVRLDEDVIVQANLIHVAEKDVKIGMRVKPYWAPLPDGHNLLLFEPDT